MRLLKKVSKKVSKSGKFRQFRFIWQVSGRQKAEGRRQEAGGRRQEAGGRI